MAHHHELTRQTSRLGASLCLLLALSACGTSTKVEITSPLDGEVDADGLVDVDVAWIGSGAGSKTVEIWADGRVIGSTSASGFAGGTTVAIDLSDAVQRGWPVSLEARVAGATSPIVEILLDDRVDAMDVLRVTDGFELSSDGTELNVTTSVIGLGGDPVEDAVTFLELYGAALGVERVRDTLYVTRVTEDQDTKRVFFAQHVDGVPIDGTQVTVLIDGPILRHLSVRLVAELPASALAQVSEAEAIEAGVDAVTELMGQAVLSASPQLRFQWDGVGEPTLVWRIRASDTNQSGEAVVDAYSGEVTKVTWVGERGLDLDVIDVNSEPSDLCWNLPGTAWWYIDTVCDESGCINDAPPDAHEAFRIAGPHDTWLADELGMDSYDGDGGQVEILVDLGGPSNAWYSGSCDHFAFTPGEVVVDVFGHELGHGIDAKHVGLDYLGQSGALDEHIADIRGVLFEGYMGDLDPEIGEDSGTVRNIADPLSYQDPDHIRGYFECGRTAGTRLSPCPMDPAQFDSFDVHYNSGIPNKAFALLIFGGIGDTIPVQPIGTDKVLAVLHESHSRLPGGPSATIRGYAARTRWSATDFARDGRHGFDSNDVCQVRNAFAAVGIGLQDSNCDGLADGATSTDADGDGVDDGLDNCMRWFNPAQRDLDGDGIGDPCDPDLDEDGVINGEDNCPRVASPSQNDRDGDGKGDVCDDSDSDGVNDEIDNCPGVANSDQFDPDRDGLGGPCDDDRDGDGHLNDQDNCPDESNNNQIDSDNDGLGDHCSDRDGDGRLDHRDYCPDDFDRHPRDADSDGLLDACEDDDDDNDGILDVDDPCPFIANSGTADADGDGVGDACDLCPDFASHDNFDLDQDGLADPCDDDDDNDGIQDDAVAQWGSEIPVPDELSVLLLDPSEFTSFWSHPNRVPLPACATPPCPDWIEAGTEITVETGAWENHALMILNDRGEVVERTEFGGDLTGDRIQQTLTYRPRASSWSRLGERAVSAEQYWMIVLTDGGETPVQSDLTFTLQ